MDRQHSPKFGVWYQLWNVYSTEAGDAFFTIEHVFLQLNVGFLKWNAFLLKFTRFVQVLFSVFSMSTLKKTA